MARMQRLKLQHEYHDAMIHSVEYRGSEDLVLEVDLCGCADLGAARVHLSFTGVRNMPEVKAALEAARSRHPRLEIIGIMRHELRGYILGISLIEGIRVDAKGIHET